ncbi:MAG: ribosome small subunit-dependent GTPase A [Peptococcaceae bacterium]|jgi:ribosome biogenesis GTPase|nr:ribosome small subunit-dependent GTPase A [Peptococcaceae bacterium]
MIGILLKRTSGFYYVFAEDQLWECSLRGRFRIHDQDFLPGDRVWIQPGLGKKATIEKVEPRRNQLVRPPVTNIDQVYIVFACRAPEPDLHLLDRLLVQAEHADIQPVLVVTKKDLSPETGPAGLPWFMYQAMGYSVYHISVRTGEGIAELRPTLAEKISIVAGPSGVGKSSLLNALSPGLSLKTGEVGKKLQRGRHTTRHVEMMPCAAGLIADTPGFSNLFLPAMRREELAGYFRDFQPYLGQCRFQNCRHDREPDCEIKAALREGRIEESRYRHYLAFLHETIENERRY